MEAVEYEFCQMPEGCRFENKFNRHLEVREPAVDSPELAYTGIEGLFLLGAFALVCIFSGIFLLLKKA